MGLLKILEDNEILSSIDFQHGIKKTEQHFGLLLLSLLNDDVNNMEFIIKSLMEIINVPREQAMSMTLLAQFKGSVSISYGNREYILKRANEFASIGISVKVSALL